MNPDRPATPLSALPVPAYDLVDFDAYENSGGARKQPYATGIRRPYVCNRRFNPYDTGQVVSELVDLVRRHRRWLTVRRPLLTGQRLSGELAKAR